MVFNAEKPEFNAPVKLLYIRFKTCVILTEQFLHEIRVKLWQNRYYKYFSVSLDSEFNKVTKAFDSCLVQEKDDKLL